MFFHTVEIVETKWKSQADVPEILPFPVRKRSNYTDVSVDVGRYQPPVVSVGHTRKYKHRRQNMPHG